MPYRALLLTDLVDSTGLVDRRGDAWAAQAWAAHDRLARDLLVRLGGREMSRTDGFFLMFGSPVEAARFALAYHQGLAQIGLTARVGLHAGQVTLRDNTAADMRFGAVPTEVDGLATPLTARIMALARGGQTLMSAAAMQALGDTLRDEARLDGHGFFRSQGHRGTGRNLRAGATWGRACHAASRMSKRHTAWSAAATYGNRRARCDTTCRRNVTHSSDVLPSSAPWRSILMPAPGC